MNLSRSGVFSTYAFHSDSNAFVVVDCAALGAIVKDKELVLRSKRVIGSRTGKPQPNNYSQRQKKRKLGFLLQVTLAEYVEYITRNLVEASPNYVYIAKLQEVGQKT